MTTLSSLLTSINEFFHNLTQLLSNNAASVSQWYTAVIRWLLPILAVLILLTVLRSMFRVKNPPELWGRLLTENWGEFPLRHWECTIGRARHCDVRINVPTISRTQCVLLRESDGRWLVSELTPTNPTQVNGKNIEEQQPLNDGDLLNCGGAELRFSTLTAEDLAEQKKQRITDSRPAAVWIPMLLLTIFQLLTTVQLMLTRPEYAINIVTCYTIFIIVSWLYLLVFRAAGKTGFEPEFLAFFGCTLNLAITASSAPSSLFKQLIAILLGLFLMIALGWYLRDLKRAVKTRYPMAGAAIILLSLSLIFGVVTNGAQNWISIAGISVQPSEFAKICFIFAGAATLDRLFVRHNLWGFIIFSGICFGALALMSDFGTATIFFVVFIVLAYLRLGDFATLGLISGVAVAGIILVLRFIPYIANRFAVWGHAWEFASSSGYQQVRTMSAAASGGLIGVGAGNGWLHEIGAANTDLVFGMLCEEWGLIIALLAIANIIALSVFAIRMSKNGRSAFYVTAACAATSLLVFQTMLNVLGSVDILPLTGVTLPFISCGGSSMIACWGLLSFVKAVDTRQNASFAVKRKVKLHQQEDKPEQKTQTHSTSATRQKNNLQLPDMFGKPASEKGDG